HPLAAAERMDQSADRRRLPLWLDGNVGCPARHPHPRPAAAGPGAGDRTIHRRGLLGGCRLDQWYVRRPAHRWRGLRRVNRLCCAPARRPDRRHPLSYSGALVKQADSHEWAGAVLEGTAFVADPQLVRVLLRMLPLHPPEVPRNLPEVSGVYRIRRTMGLLLTASSRASL